MKIADSWLIDVDRTNPRMAVVTTMAAKIAENSTFVGKRFALTANGDDRVPSEMQRDLAIAASVSFGTSAALGQRQAATPIASSNPCP